MQTILTKPPAADTAPVSSTANLTKARKAIVKLEERQTKLNAAREKAAKELADAELAETIRSGQTEFLKTVEELDVSTREMVFSNVLPALKDESRRAKIQAWVATIPEPKARFDPSHQRDQTEVSSGAAPTPAANQSESASAKPKSPVAHLTPPE